MTLSRQGVLLCLCGPAGSGKTTVSKFLIDNCPPCAFSVSVTSRAPRAGEIDGQAYHFVSREEFEKKIAQNDFFEFEEVHGNLYGTLKSSVSESINKGVDLLLDIDIQGALTFKRQMPENTAIVFLVPPSASILVERLKARGSISEAELSKRLGTAKKEYETLLAPENAKTIDFFLVNNDLKETCASVASILASERHKLKRLNTVDVKQICII